MDRGQFVHRGLLDGTVCDHRRLSHRDLPNQNVQSPWSHPRAGRKQNGRRHDEMIGNAINEIEVDSAEVNLGYHWRCRSIVKRLMRPVLSFSSWPSKIARTTGRKARPPARQRSARLQIEMSPDTDDRTSLSRFSTARSGHKANIDWRKVGFPPVVSNLII